jgi:hypothetical protein
MSCFTPKLAVEVKDFLDYIPRVPRPFTKYLIHRFGTKQLVGAEVGFGWGDNAESLLKELNITRLFCVDPYIMKAYYEGAMYNPKYADANKSKYSLIKQDSRVTFIELPSEKGIPKLPQGLDFIYIDGNHHYNVVLSDLRLAMKQVSTEGVVGGHDFVRGAEQQVIPAVLDFAVEIGQTPVIDMPDFWFTRKAKL